jgi:3-phosphoshikimate 1-carboxyvinyltransferase|tara:strand:+ start:13323 stop:14567 length:1245 start_codon:yes stop_codon:yes gene_type:complete
MIKKINKLNAEVEIPGSKSYTNRALLVSALANGKSIIRNPLISDDTKYMISALREFGIKIIRKINYFEVYGTSGKIKTPKKGIFVRNTGTAMRFLTGFASLAKGRVILTGDKSMQKRPIQDLLSGLKKLGVNTRSKNKCPPVTINGGNFIGGKTNLQGAKSSQYLSSILMAAPYAKNNVEVDVVNLTSKPYIDVTLDVMKEFGVKVINKNYRKFIVKINQKYKAKKYAVEGDASSASYFFGAAAITKGKVKVKNINPKSVQGDVHFADVLEKMGCKVKKGKNFIELKGGNLRGVSVDMNNMPDTVQTLGVVACFAKGNTIITNIGNLRKKETDRIKALATELRKIGAKVRELKGGLLIKPNKLHGAEIKTYNDHRMAMSFAIAGLRINDIKIQNPDCVAKSFPNFWEKFEELYK